MSETEEPFDYAAAQRSRDERWRVVTAGLDVERELSQSTVVATIINLLAEDRKDALEQFVHANPADVGMIARLQAIVRQARMVELVLQTAIERGRAAQMALIDDDPRQEP